MEEKIYKYEVALSFAGAQRQYVKQVAEELKKLGVRCFYDEDESVNLWGKNLYQYFRKTYFEMARYCIVFISKEYKEQRWTIHESQVAQERNFWNHDAQTFQEYILPVRFDDTKIDGFSTITGYIDARQTSPQELAKKVSVKVADCDAKSENEEKEISEIYKLICNDLKNNIAQQIPDTVSFVDKDNTLLCQKIASVDLCVLMRILLLNDVIEIFVDNANSEITNPAAVLMLFHSKTAIGLKLLNIALQSTDSIESNVSWQYVSNVLENEIIKLIE